LSSPVSGGTIAVIIIYSLFSAATVAIELASIFMDNWGLLGPTDDGEYGRIGLLTIRNFDKNTKEWNTSFITPPRVGLILMLLLEVAFVIAHVAVIIVIVMSKWGDADRRRSAMRIILFPLITACLAPFLFLFAFGLYIVDGSDPKKQIIPHSLPVPTLAADLPQVPAFTCTWLVIGVNFVYFWVALIVHCCIM
ncbi:hypothetical protein PENTCL1PPCAC_12016, partial [Pristionchus entomophagus]